MALLRRDSLPARGAKATEAIKLATGQEGSQKGSHPEDVPGRMHAEDVAWAWAAGLFEGEGGILYHRTTSSRNGVREERTQRGLMLCMTCEDVVRRFHQIVGVGVVYTHRNFRRHLTKSGRPYKEKWEWRVNRWAELEVTLLRLLPYFGARKRAMAEALLADPARRCGANGGRG